MNNIQFISTQYLKQNTAIENNVDDSLLQPFIIKAGDIYLKSLLGQTFYNHLVSAYINNTATQAEIDLKELYIKPYVAELTYYIVYLHLYQKTTNKGIQKENAEFSSSSMLKDTNGMRDSIKNFVDLYEIKLEREIRLGYKDGRFPLAQKFCDDNPVKRNNSSRMGIYLGKNI